jgi:putative MATE family efflux protein
MKTGTLELMGKAPVSQAIIKLALPTMIGMIAQSVYNMVDLLFIGMTGDPNLVAGVSLAMPLFFLTQGLGGIFAMGSASYISRKLGAGDFESARRTNATSIYLSLLIALCMTALCLIFKDSLLKLSGASANTYGPTDSYFTIVAAFAVVMMLNVTMQGLIRSEGATLQATIGMMLGIVANIILDPLFIFTFGWGIRGAAWATIVGATISDIYFIMFFRSGKSQLSIAISKFKPNRVMMSEILKIGIPNALSQVIMSACLVLTNNYAAAYGDHVVAACGINMRICSLAFMLIMGLAMGFQPFAGYNYGAKNYKRLTKGLYMTVCFSTGVALLIALCFFIMGRQLIGIFIDDDATIKAGEQILRAFVFGMPFFGAQVTLMVTFQALGKPIRALIVTLGRQCFFYIPLLLILNSMFGFGGFVFVQPAADIMTSMVAITLAVTLIRSFGNLKKVEAIQR